MSSSPYSRALPIMLGTALVLGFLYWAKPVVVPVALAVLFTFLLAPVSNWLEKLGLPRAPAVGIVTVLALVLVVGLFYGVTRQIGSLLDEYPKYEQNVAAKIEEYRARGRTGLLDKLETVSDRVNRQLQRKPRRDMSDGERELERAQRVRIVEESAFSASQLARATGRILEPIAVAGLVLVLVMFMLLHREDLRDRVISLIGVGALAETTRALDDAGERVGRYLLMQLSINALYGLAVGIGLWLIGVPYAPLWGFFATLMRYIPYLGPWLAAALPIVLTLLIEREWTTTLMVIALFGVLELITNMLVEPLVYGRGIGVSQAALLVAVAFWTWLWGPVGLVLASPLTVCLVVLGRYVPFLKFLDTLLGDRPALSPSQRFYQRMLAQDEDEAAELLDDLAALDGLDVAYDTVVVPMLASARADARNGRLDASSHARMVEEVGDVVQGHKRVIRPDSMVGGERMRVLAIPARDATDEVAVTMLSKLVDHGRIELTAGSSSQLASDVVASVREAAPKTVVLASVPPGGLAHARYLCKRLRADAPDLRILVMRPGLREEHRKGQLRDLTAAGADRLAGTLAEAVAELNKMAMLD